MAIKMKYAAIIICSLVFVLCGCSTVILGYGLTQGRIFGSGGYPASRDHVIAKLGQPIRTTQLDPSIRLSEIRWNTGPDLPPAGWWSTHRREKFEIGVSKTGPDGKVYFEKPDPDVVRCDEFSKGGRIPPSSYAPSSLDLALATAGGAEVISIPAAVAYRAGGRNTVNRFWVWYDVKNRVVAYEWEFTESNNSKSLGKPPS